MSNNKNDKDNLLAAEFAMGVLEGGQKDHAAHRYQTDRAFRQLVEDWQNRLSPMLAEIESVTPSETVWAGIEQRTGLASPRRAAKPGLWSSLAFWRGVSFVSAGLAMAAVAALIIFDGESLFDGSKNDPLLVAGLTATGKAPAFLARFDPATGGLVVQVAKHDASEARVAELWLIPGDGKPRSLGLLSAQGTATMKLDGKLRALVARGGTLAVSLEPQGGSPTGVPTGPVIASGKLLAL